jgi:predicted ATP-grasp superfamily ATP-dependent carboligase
MKILLSDGSGLTARQTATQLARAGHRVEALTPDGLCLCRFTRHVSRLHRVPSYGADPLGWLDAALAVYQAGRFDVLFPTQEQVAVLAHSAGRLAASGVVTAVPPFEAVRAVQDKVSAFATLGALGIPQPETAYVGSAADLRALSSFPVFVKLPIGTATTGVRRVESAAALDAVAADLAAAEAFAGDGGVVAQQPASGPLVMVQSVFVRGELAAAHANLRVREGPRGGASHKRSLDDPARVIGPLETLGRALRWHGGLSADAILTEGGPLFIDINPRLVEPGNAWRSGVDLVGALLAACADPPPAPAPHARPPAGRGGVATHQLLVAVLGASQQSRGRRAVAAEIAAALTHTGSYRGSTEELTPARGDPRAAVPVLVATAAVMIRPALWRWFASGSVAGYALTAAGWESLLRTPPT